MIPPNPTIAIVGAGAVGTYYGARLVQHGKDVRFLLRSDYSHVRDHGIEIRSCEGDFTLSRQQIHVYDDPKKMPRADFILITLKTTANSRFPELIVPLLKDSTLILTLQNGLGNEERLAELFGEDRVLGGMAFTCINRVGPGIILHTDYGLIRIGELHGPPTPRLREIADLFNASSSRCELADNLTYGKWEKLVWNIPFNGLGAALDLSTDLILRSPQGVQLVEQLMHEVLIACRPLGIELPQSIVGQKIQQTRTMGAYKTSMQIDRELGRSMEIESIIGMPLSIAQMHGVPVPRMQMLHEMLKVLDAPQ